MDLIIDEMFLRSDFFMSNKIEKIRIEMLQPDYQLLCDSLVLCKELVDCDIGIPESLQERVLSELDALSECIRSNVSRCEVLIQ